MLIGLGDVDLNGKPLSFEHLYGFLGGAQVEVSHEDPCTFLGKPYGNGTANPPEDINQYKSAKGKEGNYEAALAVINKRQNLPPTTLRR